MPSQISLSVLMFVEWDYAHERRAADLLQNLVGMK